MSGTILTTERLRLRRPEVRDADGAIAFFRSQRARYAGGTKDAAGAWRSFALELGHWELRGYGMFALTTHDDDTCLGLVGPWYPEGWPETEIGWIVWPTTEGKGYGYEAALAARGYAYQVLGWDTVVSYIDENNSRSIALAERLGATWDHAAITPSADCRVYRHPAPAEVPSL